MNGTKRFNAALSNPPTSSTSKLLSSANDDDTGRTKDGRIQNVPITIPNKFLLRPYCAITTTHFVIQNDVELHCPPSTSPLGQPPYPTHPCLLRPPPRGISVYVSSYQNQHTIANLVNVNLSSTWKCQSEYPASLLKAKCPHPICYPILSLFLLIIIPWILITEYARHHGGM